MKNKIFVIDRQWEELFPYKHKRSIFSLEQKRHTHGSPPHSAVELSFIRIQIMEENQWGNCSSHMVITKSFIYTIICIKIISMYAHTWTWTWTVLIHISKCRLINYCFWKLLGSNPRKWRTTCWTNACARRTPSTKSFLGIFCSSRRQKRVAMTWWWWWRTRTVTHHPRWIFVVKRIRRNLVIYCLLRVCLVGKMCLRTRTQQQGATKERRRLEALLNQWITSCRREKGDRNSPGNS